MARVEGIVMDEAKLDILDRGQGTEATHWWIIYLHEYVNY